MLLPFYRAFAVLIALVVATPCVFAAESESEQRGANPYQSILSTDLKNITLPTTNDQTLNLASDPTIEFTVACFLGTECPLAKLYGPRLQKLADEFAEEGFQFVGINSNIQDSMEELREYGDRYEIRFPLVKDYDRSVALAFGATRTPEIFIVDRKGSIRYQGRVDDQYKPGVTKNEAKKHDLRNAIEDLAAGHLVRQPETTAVGCLIALPRKTIEESAVTYCNQVVRVLRRNCTECHRRGEIGPFALQDYDEVIGWADMSLEVIEENRMPPWHADPSHGNFANARNMSDADKQILQDWVDAGLPYGNAADLPPPEKFVEGWRLPEQPEMVFSLFGQEPSQEEAERFRENFFEVPSQGTVEYQYFVVDPDFTEDTWIRGAEVMPGNAAVVHHCIVFVRPPDGDDFRDIGFLTAYVPGQVRGLFPKGYAQRVPAGSKLVFQMHYTPTGKPENDRTKLGLLFADENDVTHEIHVLGGINQELEIPPGKSNHTVEATMDGYSKNSELLLVTPHMHLRGKSYKFFLEYEDRSETLLSVPNYDFNWQHNYELREPIPLRDVKSLRFEATFDNSYDNPFNPDPEEFVYWGDQTWQEMAVTFVAVAKPRESKEEKSAASHRRPLRQRDEEAMAKRLAELDAKATAYADKYFSRLDKNPDGYISEREMPNSVRVSGRWSLDANGDRQITHEEIKSAWLNDAYRLGDD